ncbi:hypothetical protein [Armatimonas rosea]|uniref:WD40 repeat protein n=1 Tax=Armatimonas rosea TaxID=685828 RepID=A0A7W9SUU7_ARMRO|nr:hypothetical protein [Armatimonas rosea]MBB6053242.1 WD40 repeat protein [Armatimonas rosea]
MHALTLTRRQQGALVPLGIGLLLPAVATALYGPQVYQREQIARGLAPAVRLRLPSGKSAKSFSFDLETHRVEVEAVRAETASEDENLRVRHPRTDLFVFDPATGALLAEGSGSTARSGEFSDEHAISADRQFIAKPTDLYLDHGWKVLDPRGKELSTTPSNLSLSRVLLSPHGKYLLGWGQTHSPRQGRGEGMYFLTGPQRDNPRPMRDLSRWDLIAFTPDETGLMVVSPAPQGLWSRLRYIGLSTTASWECTLPQESLPPQALTVSPDGRFVAVASQNSLLVFDAHNGLLLRTIPRTAGWASHCIVRFSPESRWLGDLTPEGVDLWDWQKHRP